MDHFKFFLDSFSKSAKLRALRALVLYVLRALRFMSPFSLCTQLSCTLSTLCPKITFCIILMKNRKSYLDGRIDGRKEGLLFFVS